MTDLINRTKITTFPQSSVEHEKWIASGKEFIGGQWYESSNAQFVDKQDPIDVSGLGEGGDFTIPENGGEAPDISGATGAFESMKAFWEEQQKQTQERQKQYEEQLKTAQAEQEKTQSFLDKFLKRDTLEETKEKEFEELGIKPEEYFAEIESSKAS